MDQPSTSRNASEFARQAGTSSAIGAVLLLYFGFARYAEPSGADLFSLNNWLFFHTLRIGGIAMAGVTLWLWTGHRPALAADAVLAGVIGAIMVITGLGMLAGGGDSFQSAIIVLCGGIFIRAAWQSGQHFRFTAPGPVTEHPATLRENRESPIDNQHRSGSQVRETRSDLPSSTESTPIQEPPPEGYLASLAKKRSS